MTTKQRMSILLDWWPAACNARGWDPKDRDLRLRVVSDAVGRELDTMSTLNNTTDIDKVKAHLGYLADQVDATIETDHPELGDRRRLLWLIGRHSQALSRSSAPLAYAAAIARDRFGHARLDDLSDRQLVQLRNTLAARLSATRARRKNESLTSEETFPDQVAFQPEPETAECPF
jgi:hypothetical protein